MEELTCPNCNVDMDPQERKQNLLHCPTCGFDLSEAPVGDQSAETDFETDDPEDAEDEENEDEEEEE